MKTNATICSFLGFLFLLACNLPKTAFEEEQFPPVADFLLSQNIIIADETTVDFINTSLGHWDTTKWELGYRESQRYVDSFQYSFQYAGEKEIVLTVSGILGFDKTSKKITVHAMNPGCINYVSPKTHREDKITQIRSTNSLVTGRIEVKNDFSEPIQVSVFHSDSWLDGYYLPFKSYALGSNATLKLLYQSGDLIVGNDWGIRVIRSNGEGSCIRTIGEISSYNNGQFNVMSKRVYDGW
jgi:hypothetical protein